MAGPTKPYDEERIGDHLQANYVFLEKLFDGRDGRELRRELWELDEGALRERINAELKLKIPRDVRIMLVDIENARAKPEPGDINPRTESFYVVVLPPVPRRERGHTYKEMAAWEGAWHHAIVDGYGM
jgi:hypothetical protein